MDLVSRETNPLQECVPQPSGQTHLIFGRDPHVLIQAKQVNSRKIDLTPSGSRGQDVEHGEGCATGGKSDRRV